MHLDAVRLLLQHGANANAQGGKYGTALQALCSSEEYHWDSDGVQSLELLVAHGADVSIRGGQYGSALRAAKFNNAGFVHFLLLHGATDSDMEEDGPCYDALNSDTEVD
ncbi:uncharacterized protein B0I36DRAFT_367356 [Microdochium trichocladiopsis]|uniref:Ankyrin repeat-containing domain protein n=1 Tax=Microdochium trichocladiopsis TaxID=1682393 RepID=A0A9P9BK67_9PEZI|nr:uncharacterized protein B0I36DRAFT_367356 [Microdochium trichocladiopsis]KAH7020876.1 hypothetical protein B0I36DRAFT_367356 [Microdochium trichocladiopsis]